MGSSPNARRFLGPARVQYKTGGSTVSIKPVKKKAAKPAGPGVRAKKTQGEHEHGYFGPDIPGETAEARRKRLDARVTELFKEAANLAFAAGL
jgi:hypothetical protein